MKARARRLAAHLRDGLAILGITLLLLAALELGARAFYAARGRGAAQSPGGDPRAASPVYAGEPWAAAYFREFHASSTMEWHSYVYWRRRPFAGELIHIDGEGLRRTANATPAGEAAVTLFTFGGSTLWGTGARDEHTIPSELSRRLGELGVGGVHVVNFGESGYVSTQEVILLLRQLQAGRVPDGVIFYDGVNDVAASFQNGVAGLPQNEDNRRAEFNYLKRLSLLDAVRHRSKLARALQSLRRRLPGAGGTSAEDPEPTPAADPVAAENPGGEPPPDLARETVEVYRRNLELVRALAERYGFRALFVWQPTVFSRASPPAEEAALRDEQPGAARELYEKTYAAVAGLRGEDDFLDLQHVFDDRDEPLFIDFCHLGEGGNEIVARAIAGAWLELTRGESGGEGPDA